jgi:hypothetical protein
MKLAVLKAPGQISRMLWLEAGSYCPKLNLLAFGISPTGAKFLAADRANQDRVSRQQHDAYG